MKEAIADRALDLMTIMSANREEQLELDDKVAELLREQAQLKVLMADHKSEARGLKEGKLRKTATLYISWEGERQRITVQEGGLPITREYSGPTDEGFRYNEHSYTLEDNIVFLQRSFRGQDCDGQIEYYQTLSCGVGDLLGRTVDGKRWPEWKTVESNQRDYAAEDAGY